VGSGPGGIALAVLKRQNNDLAAKSRQKNRADMQAVKGGLSRSFGDASLNTFTGDSESGSPVREPKGFGSQIQEKLTWRLGFVR